jgi:peptidoglycan L-alanyl-D-glutamate endopeptidase CwlK
MINSRDLALLHPPVLERVQRFLDTCKQNGVDLLVTSTYRDFESQAALYAQGRTTPGHIVTNAKPGESFHNWHCAVDVVPIVNGKCVWDATDPLWAKVGALGKASGLDWAGGWTTFKETAHFQYTGGLTIADLKNGKVVA